VAEFDFEKYLIRKRIFEKMSDPNIDWGLVLGSYIAQITKSGTNFLIFKFLFERYEILKFDVDENSEFSRCYVYYIERHDLKNLIEAYRYHAHGDVYKIKRSISLISFIKTIILFMKEILRGRRNRDTSLFDLLLYCFGRRMFFELKGDSFFGKYKKVIFFNSSFKAESLIAQICNSRGIDTYSLQHGMYSRFVKAIPLDIINYENVSARKLLCWGGFSFDQIRDLTPKSCEVIKYGYPYSKVKEHYKYNNSLYVVLPRPIFFEESLQLINIIKQANFNIIIKLHPNDSCLCDMFTSMENFTVDTDVDWKKKLTYIKFKAIIGFNTTALCDAVFRNQHVIVYDSGNNESIYPGLDIFCNLKQLLQLIETKNNSSSLIDYYFHSIDNSMHL
jgi:hypothetical protein